MARRRFGQSVDRHERFGIEAVRREALRETLESFGAHRFGAVRRSAPAAQIQSFQIFVGDFSDAKFIGEIRSRRNSGSMLLNRAQPALRPAEERQRRHHDQRDPDEERNEPSANQSHVVIQRQPGNTGVVRANFQAGNDGVNIGKQVGVGQYHAFGIAGRTGGVLQERNVFSRGPDATGFRPAAIGSSSDTPMAADAGLAVDNFCALSTSRKLGTRGFQELGQVFGLPPGNQKLRFGVAQNVGLASGVFRDAVGAKRRINRDGNAAGQQNAGEAVEKFRAGRKHDRDGLAGFEAAAAKFQRHDRSVFVQIAKGNRPELVVFFVDLDMDAMGFAASAQADNFGKRRLPGEFVPGRRVRARAGAARRRLQKKR